MSTRAKVGILLPEEEKVKCIRILQDGYPKYAGNVLAKYYDTEEKIHALLEKGDLRRLGKTLEECVPASPATQAEVITLPQFVNRTNGLDYLYIFIPSVGWRYNPCHE